MSKRIFTSVVSVLAFGVASIIALPAHASREDSEGVQPEGIGGAALSRQSSPSSSPERQSERADRFVEDVPDYVSGDLVVDLKDDVSDEQILDLGSAYGIALRDNSPSVKHDANLAVAHVDPSRVSDLMARLSTDSRVEGVEVSSVARAFFAPNDPKYADQWHLVRAGAERAWDYACGAGVTVAVVDTGIACYDAAGFMKGTDLSGTTCVAGYNFVAKNEIAADDQGHGTHVAGTIAQTTHNGVGVAGLAHCAKLMPVKVLSKGGWGTMADVAEGIRWAADHGAQIINLSLGSSAKSKVVESAVTYAYRRGVVVVAAAGNSGKAVGYPAAYKGAIAVSATDKNDAIAWFSSRGPEVAIGAPGVGVTQQTICEAGKNKCEQWGVFNGTSMAAPHVAGAAALLVGQGVTAPDAVLAALQSTAAPKEDKTLFGAGILEAGNAVFRAHWSHVAIRLAALLGLWFLVVRRIKRNGGTSEGGFASWTGGLLAGVGLVPFLPALGLSGRLGSLRWVAELATRPFGEWDLLMAPGVHAWLPLASVLPAFALTTLFFNSKRVRPFVGGVAVGTAALLLQLGLSGETFFAMGPLALRGFCAINVAACLWVGRMNLDAKRT